MNEKAMIEIIKEIVECNKDSCKDCKIICSYFSAITSFYEKLISEGYRKIPKDAVVIKEEDYFRLCERANCAPLDRPLIDKRKETAQEIIKMIEERYGYMGILEDIAKQFGVEVEE